jgi:epidermal growth factor receptor kinase substrate 8
LVHFLFTPLALIVDASHDTCYDPNLPARVVEPLPTRDAINLLNNCVTSKEMELLRSLGDAWTIPRDKWKGQIHAQGSYHPVFFDGWSPDYPVIDELDAKQPQSRRMTYNDFEDFGDAPTHVTTTGVMNVPPPGSPVIRDFSTRSEISIDSIERNGGAAGMMSIERAPSGSGLDPSTEAWIEELQARDAKICQGWFRLHLKLIRYLFIRLCSDVSKNSEQRQRANGC